MSVLFNPFTGQFDLSGANESLSNLTDVSVNSSMLPATDGNVYLGDNELRWGEVWAQYIAGTGFVGFYDRVGNPRASLTAATSPSGAANTPQLRGPIAGVAASVVYEGEFYYAVTTGTAGNSIALVFDGIDSIATVLADWNAANPSNTAGTFASNTAVVPAAGTATLTGGLATPAALGVITRNNSSNTADATLGILVETGNKTVGTANSGDIKLRTGTATGTRGKITLQDGSQGIVGYVWTSSGVNGEGNWEPPDGITAEYDAGNSGASKTIDFANGYAQKLTMTASCTLTMSTLTSGSTSVIRLVQGGAGSYTMTWPASVKWNGGVVPTLSTAIGAIDLATFYCDGTTFYGTFGAGYA
jgi:hypothetical protein